ncbi:MAG: ParB/RepB/Spo0J family partition protein [Clostridia bacterium]|nr:ParB/RepB/Spo0J family partition protein [Clostridia bacterium]
MAKKQSGLGRDLYSLFDDNMVGDSKKSAAEMLRIADVEPRGDQPRKTFERESLEQLADSIGAYGVLQPIIVRPSAALAGTYEIIAGERRWRAAKMAGLSEIPAVVLDSDELKAAQVALIENVQREDLNPIEEAAGYRMLIDRFGLSQEQVAAQVGKSRPAVANMLRLLDLPEEVLEMVRTGELTQGHARALLGLDREEDVPSLAARIVEKQLSVRDTEAAVKRLNALAAREEEDELPDAEEKDAAGQRRIYMRELEHRVTENLGRRAKITATPRKKVLEIAYSDDEDLEALLKTICGNGIFEEV